MAASQDRRTVTGIKPLSICFNFLLRWTFKVLSRCLLSGTPGKHFAESLRKDLSAPMSEFLSRNVSGRLALERSFETLLRHGSKASRNSLDGHLASPLGCGRAPGPCLVWAQATTGCERRGLPGSLLALCQMHVYQWARRWIQLQRQWDPERQAPLLFDFW